VLFLQMSTSFLTICSPRLISDMNQYHGQYLRL
jgi:hypothetical protein